jgi:putative transcriptional regulator
MMKIELSQFMDEATRAALASGRAEPALGLFVDSLMAMRGISDLAAEAIAGAALECEDSIEVLQHALDMVFAAIERGPQPAPKRSLRYPELSGLPTALVDAIATAERGRGWKSAGRGVSQLQLNLSGRARTEIIRIEAGTAVPRHSHKGQELSLCLVGGYSDGIGVYGPGDVSIADPSVRHQPKADDDGACFVLAVTDAGLKISILDWFR